MRVYLLALVLALAVTPARAQVAPVSSEAFHVATERLIATGEAIASVEGASPAIAMIMVRRGQAPVIWVHGPLDVRRSTMANADTPFYVASMTKAFVGLMALKLDARGVFSLDQSLADVWPELRLPAGADPHAITFRQLLSHQGVIENDTLEFRTAYTDRVPAHDYPRILANYSTVRAPGFAYSNIGYLIYGAALETRTHRDWRSWLDQEILRPTGMTRSGTRPSRFARNQLPIYHQWLGGQNWQRHETKLDAVMHAAGGMVVSPNDMARWLELQLGEAPAVASSELLTQSHTRQIAADIQGDALNCQGYAVGWNICRIGAVDVLAHGGLYTAVRSSMAVSPELGVGFAFLSNSDSLTGALSQLTAQVFFETVQNQQWGGLSPRAFADQLRSRLPRLLQNRRNAIAENRAESRWGGWTWRPARADLGVYVGRYRSPRLGEFQVVLRDGALRAALGVTQGALEPARPDLFAFTEDAIDTPAPFAFARSDRGVSALTWNNERFERVR